VLCFVDFATANQATVALDALQGDHNKLKLCVHVHIVVLLLSASSHTPKHNSQTHFMVFFHLLATVVFVKYLLFRTTFFVWICALPFLFFPSSYRSLVAYFINETNNIN